MWPRRWSMRTGLKGMGKGRILVVRWHGRTKALELLEVFGVASETSGPLRVGRVGDDVARLTIHVADARIFDAPDLSGWPPDRPRASDEIDSPVREAVFAARNGQMDRPRLSSTLIKGDSRHRTLTAPALKTELAG